MNATIMTTDGNIQTFVFVDPFKERAKSRGVIKEVYELEYDTKNRYYKRLMHTLQRAASSGSEKGAFYKQEWIFSNLKRNNLTLAEFRLIRDSILGNIVINKQVLVTQLPSKGLALRVGDRFPEFMAINANSGRRLSNTDFKGKTILFFTFANCRVCSEAASELNKIRLKYGSDVQIFAIDPITQDRAAIQSYIGKEKFSFPYFSIDRHWTITYEIYEYPTIFAVDENGSITNKVNRFDERIIKKF